MDPHFSIFVGYLRRTFRRKGLKKILDILQILGSISVSYQYSYINVWMVELIQVYGIMFERQLFIFYLSSFNVETNSEIMAKTQIPSKIVGTSTIDILRPLGDLGTDVLTRPHLLISRSFISSKLSQNYRDEMDTLQREISKGSTYHML